MSGTPSRTPGLSPVSALPADVDVCRDYRSSRTGARRPQRLKIAGTSPSRREHQNVYLRPSASGCRRFPLAASGDFSRLTIPPPFAPVACRHTHELPRTIVDTAGRPRCLIGCVSERGASVFCAIAASLGSQITMSAFERPRSYPFVYSRRSWHDGAVNATNSSAMRPFFTPRRTDRSRVRTRKPSHPAKVVRPFG